MIALQEALNSLRKWSQIGLEATQEVVKLPRSRVFLLPLETITVRMLDQVRPKTTSQESINRTYRPHLEHRPSHRVPKIALKEYLIRSEISSTTIMAQITVVGIKAETEPWTWVQVIRTHCLDSSTRSAGKPRSTL